MNRVLLTVTITIIATIIVLISNPNSQKNVQFASGNLGFKNTSSIKTDKTNRPYTNNKKETLETKRLKNAPLPKIEKKIQQKAETQRTNPS